MKEFVEEFKVYWNIEIFNEMQQKRKEKTAALHSLESSSVVHEESGWKMKKKWKVTGNYRHFLRTKEAVLSSVCTKYFVQY